MKLHLFLFLFMASRLLYAQAVIITEIFADPTPSRGLPEREYLEIFNRSPVRIALSGYTLTYGTVRAVFPAAFIEPGEHVLVCRNSYVQEFSAAGKVIGLSNLSLNNTGATLTLSGPGENETHRVSYSGGWYTPGRSEGYSLEMIDTAYPCRGKDNWQSTQAEQGGTPGKPNSISRANPDLAPPRLLHHDLQDNQLLLFFDEILSSVFAENPVNFEIIGALTVVTQAAFRDESREAVVLTLDSPAPPAAELKIYSAEDCSGNTSPDITVIFETLPDPPSGAIRLSEVLFNPLPGGHDFVEVYNTSEQHFNLKNWQLARLNAEGEPTGHTRISSTQTVLAGNSHLAFSPDPAFLKEHYRVTGEIREVKGLPAYNIDAGTVLLLKPDSTVADRFTYSEKMHASLIHHAKGVSLEKVSFQPQHNLWVSASSDAGYATPGAPNSRRESDAVTPLFVAEPLVFHPDTDTPATWLTYRLDEGEIYAAITVLDKHGRAVRTLTRNHLMGTHGKIAWDGTDEQGRLLPHGYYAFMIRVFGTGLNGTFYAKTVIGIRP